METFKNRLPASGKFAGKREKTLLEMSGFVHPWKKHKLLSDIFLRERWFYKADKTRQSVFYLSKIVFFQHEIVYTSIGCTTFSVGKTQKTHKKQWKL